MAVELHQVSRSLVGIKTEGATPGTYSGPYIAGDLVMRIFGEPDFQTNPVLHDVIPVKEDFSTDPSLVGSIPAKLTFRGMLTASGNSTVTTVPDWSIAMAACGMQYATLESITTSGTTGTAIAGEVFDQATSLATGRFVKYDGVGTAVYFHTITGSENDTDVWTGATSGATFTPTTVATDYGIVHYPDSSVVSYSCGLMSPYGVSTKATEQSLAGGRGSWSMSADAVGAPIYIDYSIEGAMHDVLDEGTLPTPTRQAPASLGFKGTGMFTAIGADAANIQLNNWSLASGITTELPENANVAAGISYAMHTGRQFTGSFNPMLVDEASHNFWDDLSAGTEGAMDFTIGSVAGDIVDFHAPRAVYRGYGNESRGALRGLNLPFGLHRDGGIADNEIWITTR
jgi:hypothetical protein